MSNPPHGGASDQGTPAGSRKPGKPERPGTPPRPRIRPGTSEAWLEPGAAQAPPRPPWQPAYGPARPDGQPAWADRLGGFGDGRRADAPSGPGTPLSGAQVGAHAPGAQATGAQTGGLPVPPHSQPDYSNYYEYIEHHTGQQPVVKASEPEQKKRPAMGPMLFLVAGALLIVALMVGGVVLLEQRNRNAPEPMTLPDPTTAATEGAAPDPQSAPEVAPPGSVPDTEAEALTELERIREETLDSSFDRLNDSWVTQLSAKQVGLRAEGKTWTNRDILESYQQYQAQYPEALLLWSGDWSTFQMSDFWVVVLDRPYREADDALEFCAQEDLSRDDCFARKLSDTDDPEGSTKLQP